MQAPVHSKSKTKNKKLQRSKPTREERGVTVRAKNLKSTKATISKRRYRVGTRVISIEAIDSMRRYRVGTGFSAPTWEATSNVEISITTSHVSTPTF